jgi:hypothetical protein
MSRISPADDWIDEEDPGDEYLEIEEEYDEWDSIETEYGDGATRAAIFLDISVDEFRDSYIGKFGCDEEFAHSEFDDEIENLKLPDWLKYNIDWAGVAVDLMHDHYEQDNYYFRA